MSPSPKAIPNTALPTGVTTVDCSLEDLRTEIETEGPRIAHERSFAEGKRQASEGVAETIERISQAFDDELQSLVRGLREEAVSFAIALTEHLMKKQINEGEYDTERIVRDTLFDSGVGRGTCTVHLNPKDFKTLEGIPFRSGTSLEADIEVLPAEIQITTPQGLFVRDLKEALTSVSECLLEENA